MDKPIIGFGDPEKLAEFLSPSMLKRVIWAGPVERAFDEQLIAKARSKAQKRSKPKRRKNG